MNGWMGKILRIDLSDASHEVEELDEDLAHDFVGARGFAVKFLYDEVDGDIDPFVEDNKLIFAAGPLTGSGAVCGCRSNVAFKSPLGHMGFANAGGFFGAEMKFAGYDVIIIEGKAAEPVYISINNEQVEILPADHLWGKGVHETERIIKSQIEDSWKAKRLHIASIGPAGEKLANIAAIMVDKHNAYARSGPGAVMGSKNLKAIAVTGTQSVGIADVDGFKNAVSTLLGELSQSPMASQIMPAFGSANIVNTAKEVHILATRNFQETSFEGANKISGEYVTGQGYLVRNRSCFGCPLGCRGNTLIKEGPFAGHAERPEFETTVFFGSDCSVDNVEAIIKANDICNDLGLDTISTGATIAAAMELFEKGYITEKDVGFSLKFGDAEAMVKLAEMSGNREGFGDIIAQGSYAMCEKFGHPEIFVGAKKLESGTFDGRRLQGMGLNYATSARGACHTTGATFISEIFAELAGEQGSDPLATEGKPLIVRVLQDQKCIFDLVGNCFFQLEGWVEKVIEQLNTATGIDYDMESLMLAAERTWNLERLFNLDAGLTAEDDTLCKRFLEEPLPSGPAKGKVCELDKMLPEYYQIRGWDENGVPTEEKLEALGLD